MSAVTASLPPMYHAWRTLRTRPDVTVVLCDLPEGLLGFCDHDKKTIWLDRQMGQRQRRAVLTHELEHLDRGKVFAHWETREETAVEVATARKLIQMPHLLAAIRWSRNVHEVAWELWVPDDLVVVRMFHLHPSERWAVRRVTADLEELIAP